ncbi:DUF1254 domain-containing protein [Streptomyces dubilierae]|uniref:DUF1254 domain-containing protein n=1 Tax=Streptomyces dubilierae TaxID=3075533 RepID=A0ABU2P424_9ACTN|nr:DUF1254 domain-containing protein [Streptomyces sp. DSM 41921]MDT0386090.1 DUF1254 domain-containing protein [Streptomyces sp. DSM 41921]
MPSGVVRRCAQRRPQLGSLGQVAAVAAQVDRGAEGGIVAIVRISGLVAARVFPDALPGGEQELGALAVRGAVAAAAVGVGEDGGVTSGSRAVPGSSARRRGPSKGAASFTEVVSPHADTLHVRYRFWMVPILDAWSDACAVVGRRENGPSAGPFLIFRPSWSGATPPGLILLKSPTVMN